MSNSDVGQRLYFQAIKVHADIRGGSVARASNDCAAVRTGDFSNFGCPIFCTFRVKANVIGLMQRREVPYRLSSDFKILDLKLP